MVTFHMPDQESCSFECTLQYKFINWFYLIWDDRLWYNCTNLPDDCSLCVFCFAVFYLLNLEFAIPPFINAEERGSQLAWVDITLNSILNKFRKFCHGIYFSNIQTDKVLLPVDPIFLISPLLSSVTCSLHIMQFTNQSAELPVCTLCSFHTSDHCLYFQFCSLPVFCSQP